MKRRHILVLGACVGGACLLLFLAAYQDAKGQAIGALQREQRVHAQLAASGVEQHFKSWTQLLIALGSLDEVAEGGAAGRLVMLHFFEAHQATIKALTRLDERGVITASFPAGFDGLDLSGQAHVREILLRRAPVISDVFRASEGFDAIAIHVPVFKGGAFRGTIGVLCDFEGIAKQYFDAIRIGEAGTAWVISRDGTLLYTAIPGATGTAAAETFKELPSVRAMLPAMLQGQEGMATYTWKWIGERRVEPTLAYAVYVPIRLGDTFWSVAVSSTEQELLASLDAFRKRLLLLVGALFVVGMVVAVAGARALVILGEERKRRVAEATLREKDERLRLAVEAGNVGLWDWDLSTNRVRFSSTWKRQLGFEEHELTDDFGEWERRVHPEDLEGALARVRGFLAQPVPGFESEFRLRHKDGSYRNILAQSAVLLDREGRPFRMLGSHIDITEGKQAAARQVESAERHASLLGTSMDGFCLYGRDGRLLEVNENYCRMSGYTSAELLTMHIADVEALETRDEALAHIERVMLQGQDRFESRHRRKDGTTFDVEVSVHRQPGEERNLVAFLKDITPRRAAEAVKGRLEAQLRQAQKLESIGRLAGGVAHDFNNLLSVILTYSSALKTDLVASRPVDAADVEEIHVAAERASVLTRQLLAFARKQVVEPVALDLNEVIRSCEKLVRRVLGEAVTLEARLPGSIWTVLCDIGQLEQVLVNLAANARDAMPRGGTLVIETENVEVLPDQPGLTSVHPVGCWVRLRVRDTGAGMSAEALAHMFEPFFTTKEVGKGTGLGLATVHGIVSQAGGHIHVTSEPGQGTTFAICLPRVDRPAEATTKAAPGAPRGRGETVLVIEDDPQVLQAAVKVLTAGGYRVLAANGGEQVLAAASSWEAPPELVVTDVVMPGLDGRTVVDELKRRHGPLRVLFVSGYEENVVSSHGLLDEGIDFLPKPFTEGLLLARVRELLDRP